MSAGEYPAKTHTVTERKHHDGTPYVHVKTGDDSHEESRLHTHVKIEKRKGDWTAHHIARGEAPLPYEIVEAEHNLLTTAGATALLNGLSTAGLALPFNTTNAEIVVGDSATAPGAGNTDMLAAVGTTQNIASSTNATPIVVTLSTPLSPAPVAGQTVVVAGHTTNTNANQTWEIGTVTSTTVFQLLNSVGNGVGGASGTIAPINKYAMRANGAGSAVVTTNSILYVAVFATINANFAWQEFGLRIGAQITNQQAAPPSTLLDRAATSLGTKTSASSWTFSLTISVA